MTLVVDLTKNFWSFTPKKHFYMSVLRAAKPSIRHILRRVLNETTRVEKPTHARMRSFIQEKVFCNICGGKGLILSGNKKATLCSACLGTGVRGYTYF